MDEMDEADQAVAELQRAVDSGDISERDAVDAVLNAFVRAVLDTPRLNDS